MNPTFRALTQSERKHARFELFTDKELGMEVEKEIFQQNLVDSVRFKDLIICRGPMKTVTPTARSFLRPR
jgi:hypothetical protein